MTVWQENVNSQKPWSRFWNIYQERFWTSGASARRLVDWLDFFLILGGRASPGSSDGLSIQAPFAEEAYPLVENMAFQRMKRSVLLSHIARGPLICEESLIRALDAGIVRGVGLDVLEKEPTIANCPMAGRENVISTPHSVFYGKESLETQHQRATDLMRKILVEEDLQGRIIFE